MKRILRASGFLILGSLSLLAGLLGIWGAGQVSTLSCSRLEPTHVNCELERAFLGIIPSRHTSLERVHEARLGIECPEGCIYWVELVTDQTVVPLTNNRTPDQDSVLVDKQPIDTFLKNSEVESLEYSLGPAWLMMMISVPFALIGGGLLYLNIHPIISNRDKKP